MASLHQSPLEEASSPATDAVGASWGSLHLLEKVGHGAFGDVYRAWDPKLSREVAVKLLAGSTETDPEHRDWVIHEARCLAAVSHPNVVTVYGADRIDNRVGFWTEFIHGRTLAALVEAGGPVRADEASRIGIELCRAVAAVHRAGLLHRDIKATNVMQAKDGRIVLLDFGTSKNFATDLGIDSQAAATTGAIGTPLYLAPELWDGAAATPQSDLYSLAVVLYFLVTSQYPVRGLTVAELAGAHRAGRRIGVGQERPELPAAFAAVLGQALDPDPSRRFASADAFEAALQAAEAVRTGRPRPRGLSARATLLLGTVAAAALISVYFLWPRVMRPEPAEGVLVAPDGELGHPSRDGRFYPWVTADSADDGDIEVWDLTTERSHVVVHHDAGSHGVSWWSYLLTDSGDNYPFSSTAMSPAGDRVVYTWASGQEFSLKLVNADGTLDRVLLPPRAAFQPVPMEWSADGRQILCWFLNANGTADLFLVPADGSSPRRLTSKPTTTVPGTTLAPDGRSAIFERLAANGRVELVRVSLDQSTPTPVWPTPGGEKSPIWVDATHLFFARPSPTAPGVFDGWMARGQGGLVRGQPTMVVPNLSRDSEFVVTGHTSLQADPQHVWTEVFTAALDLSGRTGPTAPTRISVNDVDGHAAPSWSPDGGRIAYLDLHPSRIIGQFEDPVLAIKDVASGRIQTHHPKLRLDKAVPDWLADGSGVRILATDHLGANDPNPAWGWFELDLASDTFRRLPTLNRRPRNSARFLRDGSAVYYDFGQPPRGLVWQELPSGREEVIVPREPEHPLNRYALSPDGRWIAYVRQSDGKPKTMAIVVQPLHGGDRKTLLTVTGPEIVELHTWTPDNRHLLFTRGNQLDDQQPLWLLDVNGGPPVDMHFKVAIHSAPIMFNADGRRIVYAERSSAQVLWTRPLPLDGSLHTTGGQ